MFLVLLDLPATTRPREAPNVTNDLPAISRPREAPNVTNNNPSPTNPNMVPGAPPTLALLILLKYSSGLSANSSKSTIRASVSSTH